MKKLILVFCSALILTGCITLGNAIKAADIGLQIARTVAQARAKHPDDFDKRADFYAKVYCDFRDSHDLQWEELRTSAVDNGAPLWAVELVKLKIDLECGNGLYVPVTE